METKELSCGFIVRKDGKYLACRAFGRQGDLAVYDIPKGHLEEGETPLETAKRELREETGIDLSDQNVRYIITEIGVRPYLKTKDLHLFLLDLERFDGELRCTSFFDLDGRSVPEISGYVWTDDTRLFFKSLQKIFGKLKEEGVL